MLTLNEQPSHPSHPNDLKRRKQTHTPAETREVGEISADALLLAPVMSLAFVLYSSFSNLFAFSARAFGWWHPVDAVWRGLFWKASNSCRINASKVAFYSIAVDLFVIQVIVA